VWFLALAARRPGDWLVVHRRLAALAARLEQATSGPPSECRPTIARVLETLRAAAIPAEHRRAIAERIGDIEALLAP
jgi:hypothetical protein